MGRLASNCNCYTLALTVISINMFLYNKGNLNSILFWTLKWQWGRNLWGCRCRGWCLFKSGEIPETPKVKCLQPLSHMQSRERLLLGACICGWKNPEPEFQRDIVSSLFSMNTTMSSPPVTVPTLRPDDIEDPMMKTNNERKIEMYE